MFVMSLRHCPLRSGFWALSHRFPTCSFSAVQWDHVGGLSPSNRLNSLVSVFLSLTAPAITLPVIWLFPLNEACLVTLLCLFLLAHHLVLVGFAVLITVRNGCWFSPWSSTSECRLRESRVLSVVFSFELPSAWY